MQFTALYLGLGASGGDRITDVVRNMSGSRPESYARRLSVQWLPVRRRLPAATNYASRLSTQTALFEPKVETMGSKAAKIRAAEPSSDHLASYVRPRPGGILTRMLEASFFALVVAFPTIGAITRRGIVVVLPLVAWPIYYLGMNRGWWLDGTGDGWESIARSTTLIGVVTTAAAVAVTRRISPASRQRPHTAEP